MKYKMFGGECRLCALLFATLAFALTSSHSFACCCCCRYCWPPLARLNHSRNTHFLFHFQFVLQMPHHYPSTHTERYWKWAYRNKKETNRKKLKTIPFARPSVRSFIHSIVRFKWFHSMGCFRRFYLFYFSLYLFLFIFFTFFAFLLLIVRHWWCILCSKSGKCVFESRRASERAKKCKRFNANFCTFTRTHSRGAERMNGSKRSSSTKKSSSLNKRIINEIDKYFCWHGLVELLWENLYITRHTIFHLCSFAGPEVRKKSFCPGYDRGVMAAAVAKANKI